VKLLENQEGLKLNGTYHFLFCVPGINWAKARVVWENITALLVTL